MLLNGQKAIVIVMVIILTMIRKGHNNHMVNSATHAKMQCSTEKKERHKSVIAKINHRTHSGNLDNAKRSTLRMTQLVNNADYAYNSTTCKHANDCGNEHKAETAT